jgi:L-amino acid N-acyltransferase YncA
MILRPATPADAPAMAALLNAIIALGGTTAHQRPFTPDGVAAHYISGSSVLSCILAEEAGRILGFQGLETWDGLPEGWADIGTFVAPGLQRGGVGAALMAATLAAARAAGLATINATFRADNAPGLGFYARHGFRDYATDPDWCLDDGTRVGRVSRRLDL